MANAYPRHVRIASNVQQIIAPALVGAIPKALITLTRVEVSRDLGVARLYYCVIGAKPAEVQARLDELAQPLRHRLARELETKRVPTLVFAADLDQGDIACTVS